MTSGTTPSGAFRPRSRSHARAITQRDSEIPFSPGSYSSSDEIFEPLHVSNALLDVARFFGALLFIGVTGSMFFIGPFLLFCNLR